MASMYVVYMRGSERKNARKLREREREGEKDKDREV